MKNAILTFFLPFVFVASITPAFAQVPDKQKINTPSGNVRGLVIGPEGYNLFATDGQSILQYSLKTNSFVNSPIRGHRDAILSLSITEDGKWLVSAGRDSTILIWDIETQTIVHRLTYHRATLDHVVVSKDKSILVSTGTDNKIIVYDLNRNRISFDIKPGSGVSCLALSPDNKVLAVGSESKKLLLYSVETGQFVKESTGHTDWIRGLTFNAAGDKLISWGDDSRILFWNATNISKLTLLNEARRNKGWITAFALKKDDEQIFALGTFKGFVQLDFGLSSYTENVGAPVNQILFLPTEGHYLRAAVATRGNGIILLDARKMKIDSK